MTEHFTYEGFDFTMELVDDEDHEPPWKNGDGKGIVRGVGDKDEKRPGEIIIHKDRGYLTLYDWQGTIAKAHKDGWGLCHTDEAAMAQSLGRVPTRRMIVAEAVRRDFGRMRDWCNNEWWYVGVVVTRNFECNASDASQSIWGIESYDEDGIKEVREDLASQLLPYTEFEREMRKAAEV